MLRRVLGSDEVSLVIQLAGEEWLNERYQERNQPLNEIASILSGTQIQRPNFVAMLDELERRGLAERVRSTTDRRSHAIVLTDDGRAMLDRALSVQRDQEAIIADRLGPGGRDALVALLHRLTEAPLSERD